MNSNNIDEHEKEWLLGHCQNLRAGYNRLEFRLPTGLIHGDAYRGNLLWNGRRVVLADWDGVSSGPREIDLVPTMQARRFGLSKEECAAFVHAYGMDITDWPGYQVLHDIRETSTLTALLRNTDPTSREQLRVRIDSIRHNDRRQWRSF